MLNNRIEETIDHLYADSRSDYFKMMQGAAMSVFRPIRPSDFEGAYLAISRDQGDDLVAMIRENASQNIVEFGTSFGISTLFLAQGAIATGGHIVTTEILASKAERAVKNFQAAGVTHLIDVRVGDAMITLKDYVQPIDFLLLDGWKDLYLSLFTMLEGNFHDKTIVYVDNADMSECRVFLDHVAKSRRYELRYRHQRKVALITMA